MILSKRALELKPSPTLALSTLAKKMKAEGKDVISLFVGEPDWDTFTPIKDEARKWLKEENTGATKYTPAAGFPDLRKVISEQVNHDLNLNFTFENVVVASGAKHVLFNALQCLINPGDEVIIPSPYWVSYPPMVKLSDGSSVIVKTYSEDNFKLTSKNLEKAITTKTKALILNTPSNPTGFVYSLKELKNIAAVLKENPNIVTICDDIYNRLHFDSSSEVSPHLLMAEPKLRKQVLIVNGASKTYSMTGWRLGWGVGEKDLIQAMARYNSQSISCVQALSQKAVLYALKESQKDVQSAIQKLKERRDFMSSLLKDIPHIKFKKPEGTFYIWVDVSFYLNKIGKNTNKMISSTSEFSTHLLEEKHVAVVPGIEFGEEGYLRFSFATSKAQMKEALLRLKSFLMDF